MKCPNCDLDINTSFVCECGSEKDSLARIADSLEELVKIQKEILELAQKQWEKVWSDVK